MMFRESAWHHFTRHHFTHQGHGEVTRAARMTEPRWGSTGGGDRGVDAGSQESARFRSALLGCMTQARWACGGGWMSVDDRSWNRNAVQACSPRVSSLGEAPLGFGGCVPFPVFGPQRGPVRGVARSRGRSGDGTPMGFDRRR